MASDQYVGKHAYRGDVAARYDADRVHEAAWASEQQYVHAWIDSLPSGATVLDVPTGTGRFVEAFLNRGLYVIAADISDGMLDEMRKSRWATDPRLTIMRADAEQLSLGNDSVEFLVSWRFLHLLPLPIVRKVLKEFARVCRGTLLIHVFAVDVAPVTAWYRLKNLLRPLVHRFTRPAPAAVYTPWSHITSYSHPETDLLAAFQQAGLAVAKIETLDESHRFPTRVYLASRG